MKRVILFKGFVGALLLVSLVGCASGGFQAYTPPPNPITKVGLLTIQSPGYGLQDLGSPALAFGAIGGLLAGASSMDKAKTFSEAIKDFRYEDLMRDALTVKLKKAGYEVVQIPLEREKAQKFMNDYNGLGGPPVDAYLDVTTWAVAYSNVNMMDNDFRPYLQLKTRMVVDGAPVYSESFMYGYHNPLIKATDLDAPQEYYFDNFDVLMQNQQKAVEGLEAGINMVSDQIAMRLKK